VYAAVRVVSALSEYRVASESNQTFSPFLLPFSLPLPSAMFLTRSEYDRGVNTFSPEGRSVAAEDTRRPSRQQRRIFSSLAADPFSCMLPAVAVGCGVQLLSNAEHPCGGMLRGRGLVAGGAVCLICLSEETEHRHSNAAALVPVWPASDICVALRTHDVSVLAMHCMLPQAVSGGVCYRGHQGQAAHCCWLGYQAASTCAC
jgi:hypothetical protein